MILKMFAVPMPYETKTLQKMRSITDLKIELEDLVTYKLTEEYNNLTDSEKASIEVDIFNVEVLLAEAEAEEEARPYEREFDKYEKYDNF